MQNTTYNANDTTTAEGLTPGPQASAQEVGSESGANAAMLVDVAAPRPAPAQDSKGPKRSGRDRGGAPPGNRNALRHGLRAGRLPPGCSWIAASTAELRTALENATLAARGEVSILDASAINTAVRCERHALLCQRELRENWGKLTASERLAYSREIATVSAARDKAVDRLDLPRSSDDSDPWRTLYKPLAATPSEPATETASEATPSAVAPPEAAT